MLHLSTRFCANVDPETLKDEFEDLQLLEDDAVVTSVDGHHRRLDHVWGDVMALKTPMGSVRFPVLTTVYTALLCLPHSNTDSERTFSMLRKLNTECRNHLLAETITAYLQCKINFDSCCPKFQVSSAMLRDAKHACYDNKLESLK